MWPALSTVKYPSPTAVPPPSQTPPQWLHPICRYLLLRALGTPASTRSWRNLWPNQRAATNSACTLTARRTLIASSKRGSLQTVSTDGAPQSRGPTTERLDRALVNRGLARSRGVAHDVIVQGAVTVQDRVATKPSQTVATTDRIEVAPDALPAWVGRGADKLEAAVNTWPDFAAQIHGARCVDVGASTGGFTQVLLSRGASAVVALDVGTGQLAPTVAENPRVVDRSGTHVLKVHASDVQAPFDVLVADLSFISLNLVIPHVSRWCTPEAALVLLIKPQFEVGKDALGRSGVVRSVPARVKAVAGVVDTAYDNGLALRGAMTSPIHGTHGNLEYLIWASPVQPGMMDRAAAQTAIRATAAREALAPRSAPAERGTLT